MTQRKHAWELDSGDFAPFDSVLNPATKRDELLRALRREHEDPRYDIDPNVLKRWRRFIHKNRRYPPELEALT